MNCISLDTCHLVSFVFFRLSFFPFVPLQSIPFHVRFQVLTAVSMKMTVILDVAPRSLVDM
jgi:hypothetical protein